MCDRCVELDDKIEHYQVRASRITDQAMLDGIKWLIERAKTDKARGSIPSKSDKALP
jgi:hypothetical protein